MIAAAADSVTWWGIDAGAWIQAIATAAAIILTGGLTYWGWKSAHGTALAQARESQRLATLHSLVRLATEDIEARRRWFEELSKSIEHAQIMLVLATDLLKHLGSPDRASEEDAEVERLKELESAARRLDGTLAALGMFFPLDRVIAVLEVELEWGSESRQTLAAARYAAFNEEDVDRALQDLGRIKDDPKDFRRFAAVLGDLSRVLWRALAAETSRDAKARAPLAVQGGQYIDTNGRQWKVKPAEAQMASPPDNPSGPIT